jgi:hypothetical protein
MWPDLMPGDPDIDKKKNWNPFDNNSGSRSGSPIDRFDREKRDIFGNHIQDDGPNYFDNDGMRPIYMAAKDGDKQKEGNSIKGKDNGKKSEKRGFWQGFLHPNGTGIVGTAPSTIVGGTELVIEGAEEIAKK